MAFQKAWPTAAKYRLHSQAFGNTLLRSPQTHSLVTISPAFACTWEQQQT